MLADFQQAMADMVASPQLCQMVRRKPDTLWQRYNLSGIEHRRLVDMVNNPGMSVNCTLYRANRFAPILLHLPELSHALGGELRALLEEYWDESPHTDVNFLIECERFCSVCGGENGARLEDAGVSAAGVRARAEQPAAAINETLHGAVSYGVPP